MTDPSIVGAFLESEVEALEPLASIRVFPSGCPLHIVEVARREDQQLEVRVPGRPVVVPPLPGSVLSKLRERGFVSENPDEPMQPWSLEVADAAAGVAQVRSVLTQVFEEKSDARLDIVHGDYKAEHEARRKLAAVRERVESALTRIAQGPLEKDADGDYILPVQDVHVMVSPRVMPGGPVVVRVFSITNVGVAVTPELGLFLARLNFGLMMGRFALDAEHRAIFFDEVVLGDQLTDEVLDFTVRIVAATADEWDDRLKQMYGGATYQDVLQKRTGEQAPPIKPGTGGYL
jgi:hypothetical protein